MKSLCNDPHAIISLYRNITPPGAPKASRWAEATSRTSTVASETFGAPNNKAPLAIASILSIEGVLFENMDRERLRGNRYEIDADLARHLPSKTLAVGFFAKIWNLEICMSNVLLLRAASCSVGPTATIDEVKTTRLILAFAAAFGKLLAPSVPVFKDARHYYRKTYKRQQAGKHYHNHHTHDRVTLGQKGLLRRYQYPESRGQLFSRIHDVSNGCSNIISILPKDLEHKPDQHGHLHQLLKYVVALFPLMNCDNNDLAV